MSALSLSLYLFDFYLLNSCFCLFSKLFGSFIKIVNFLNLKKKTKKKKEKSFSPVEEENVDKTNDGTLALIDFSSGRPDPSEKDKTVHSFDR